MKKESNREVLYPPVVIAHIVKDLADLFYPKIRDKSSVQIHYAVQPNGPPHMGTVMTLASAFALGEYLSSKFNIPSKIKLEALENSPGEKIEKNGLVYCKMLCDTIDNGRPRNEINMESLIKMLNSFSKNTNVDFEIESYREFQKSAFVRKTILQIIDRQDEFIPYISPSEKYLKIRIPCPKCSYMEKAGKKTQVIQNINDKTIESECFEHGKHNICLNPDNEDFIDINVPFRNVIKEAKSIEDTKKINALSMMVAGANWLGVANQNVHSLDLLGYPHREMPSRLFAPIIEDWSGAKFSKSVYVDRKSYSDIPEEFINFEIFYSKRGENGLLKALDESRSWINDPKKLFRNYSVEYLKNIFY